MSVYHAKQTVQKFGYIGDIDSGDANQEVWIGEDAYTGFVAAAAETTLVSDSANDAAAGTGAQSVKVLGLVNNSGTWAEVEETVATNGLTTVTLTNQFIRVYRAFIDASGSGGVNAGNIDVLHGATILARVATGYGQTLQAIYTIPDELEDGEDISHGVLTNWYGTIGASQSAYATVALQTNTAGKGWRTRRIAGIAEGGGLDQDMHISVDSQTDIRMRVISNGVNNSAIAGGFTVELV